MRKVNLGSCFFILSCLIFFPACSSISIDENDPAALLKEAEKDIQSDHYQIALDKLRTIKNKFPYSKYSLEAQLRIADVYFLQESFTEAGGAYESFRDLHPKHEKVGYAMFKAAKSYYLDSPSTIARDLTPAHKALTAYSDFLKRFPQAPEAEEAKKDVSQIRKLLSEKELYIGDFYFKRDLYDSAKNRYEKIIEFYSDTEAAKKAQFKLEKLVPKKMTHAN